MGKKKPNDSLFSTAIVEKRNILNEIHKNDMTLQELRFFSIYLSKINPRDVSTRVVRFALSDFQKIMEIGSDMNITHFRLVIRKLLQQIVEVPNESGYGYSAFQLFKECKLDKNEFGEWFVEIDAHDKALPLMFDFKNRYFTYELWNALKLKSSNQIRMYEILKQYEKLGKREMTISELRGLLGIPPTEYPRWDRFRDRILDSCQHALEECTDIRFTYEKGKSGAGGKWLTIVFHIYKNEKYVDQLTLDEFIEQQPEQQLAAEDTQLSFIGSEDEDTSYKNYIDFLSDACDNEFSFEEMELIARLLPSLNLPENTQGHQFARYHYLTEKYAILKIEAKKRNIPNRFGYFRAMIENERKQQQ